MTTPDQQTATDPERTARPATIDLEAVPRDVEALAAMLEVGAPGNGVSARLNALVAAVRALEGECARLREDAARLRAWSDDLLTGLTQYRAKRQVDGGGGWHTPVVDIPSRPWDAVRHADADEAIEAWEHQHFARAARPHAADGAAGRDHPRPETTR